MSKPKNRVFTTEFRVEVAKRILAGESVSKLHQELAIKRSVLYRWRDAYQKEGVGGLDRKIGRPPGVPNPSTPKPGVSAEDTLRSEIATLQRKVGEQTMQLDFFERAFKRVKESSQPSASTGATASTRRSGK
jgi:transposase-like protein